MTIETTKNICCKIINDVCAVAVLLCTGAIFVDAGDIYNPGGTITASPSPSNKVEVATCASLNQNKKFGN